MSLDVDRYRVLIISFSEISKDPRVRRQISFLADRYEVTVVGFGDLNIPGVGMIRLSSASRTLADRMVAACRLILRRFESFYWQQKSVREALAQLVSVKCDVVIANDVDSLPLALHYAGGKPVLFDAHEYAPKEFEDNFIWRLFFMRYKEYLCAEYIHRCDRMITVCEGIAEEYLRRFGVRPSVVPNSADYVEIEPAPVSADRVRLIHHGGAIPSRRIELMIRMMDYLDERFTLTLMLVKTDPAYHEKLVEFAANNPRIIFKEPVSLERIITEINCYDVGVYILEPSSFNNRYALPNKFFEFIQARLAVAVAPSPEMARLVNAHDLGVVADDFEPQSLARKLAVLTGETIEYYKQRAAAAAYELSSAVNRLKMLEIVGELAGGKSPGDV